MNCFLNEIMHDFFLYLIITLISNSFSHSNYFIPFNFNKRNSRILFLFYFFTLHDLAIPTVSFFENLVKTARFRNTQPKRPPRTRPATCTETLCKNTKPSWKSIATQHGPTTRTILSRCRKRCNSAVTSAR